MGIRTLRWMKRLRWWLVAAGAVLAAALVGFYLREYFVNYSVKAYLPPLPGPTAESRVLVIAPHPDDETIGAAGFTKETVDAGGQVEVVVVTSGDGFQRAAIAHFHTLRLGPAQFIDFGYTRERETLAAEKLLGVSASHITFLGFPDHGTQSIWTQGYTAQHPYRDPLTGAERVPYQNAFRPGAPYDAAELQGELEAIITSFKPNLIFLPDPNDYHPDHKAADEFTHAALASLDYRGAVLYRYLAHHGEWPTPLGDHPSAFLVPPVDLLLTEPGWSAFALPADLRTVKRAALEQYRTQTAVMGDYLLSFDRRNELFDVAPERALPRLGSDYAFARDAIPAGSVAVPAPEPGPLRSIEPSINLKAAHVFAAAGRVWVILALHDDPSPLDGYSLDLRTFGPDGERRFHLQASRLKLTPDAPAGALFAASDALAAFSLPEQDFANVRDIYFSASAAGGGSLVWTPWEMLRWQAAPAGS